MLMEGCGLAGSAALGVARLDGARSQLENLAVPEGALFPTSTGAGRRLSVYGAVNRLAPAHGADSMHGTPRERRARRFYSPDLIFALDDHFPCWPAYKNSLHLR